MSMNYENEVNNVGRGYGGFGGFGGGDFLTGLIFGTIFDGGLGNKKGDCAVENAILNQTIAENQQFTNLNNAVTNATYTIENDISQLKDVTSAGFYAINNSIQDAKYDNSLQTQNQTNQILSAINSSTQSIKDQNTNNYISQLERENTSLKCGFGYCHAPHSHGGHRD